MTARRRLATGCGILIWACRLRSTIIDRADKAAYRVIEDRQLAALGTTSDIHIGPEDGRLPRNRSMYQFVPHPVTAEVPEEFRTPKAGADPEPGAEQSPTHASASAPTTAAPGPQPPKTDMGLPETTTPPVEREISPSIFSEEDLPNVWTFRLSDVLAYAMRYSREVQDAKEELFLAALDLTLERHLWTPQFVGSVRADYANFGQANDFDDAMSAVSDVAVTQKFPFGGDVTARVINSLMRDLTNHVTTGEPGNIILEANLPLLRGAGRTAYESRYAAERELIYAVRDYEHFRRSFAVDIADDDFTLQLAKAAIGNAYKSYRSRRDDWVKADFENVVGRSRDIFDVSRALSTLRRTEAQLVNTKELYASGLDRFKIRLGMPVDQLLDVVNQEDDEENAAFDNLLPEVDAETAVEVALRYRLDLLNSTDRVDDTQRGVLVAKNAILPDLNLSGSATMDTDPERLNSMSYNTERTTWRAVAEIRMDDRKTQRTAYRAALVALRRSQRDNEQSTDTVRIEVRRALRRIDQQSDLLSIERMNVEENVLRLEAAQAQYDLGKIGNRDVVDADTDLLEARNRYAAAVSEYRNALLQFRRDTATLRVDDDGHWEGVSPADADKLKRSK